MIAAGVVMSNLAYLIGVVVLAVIGGLVVVLRHRKPKSVEANMASFNRGLQALAPDKAPDASPLRPRSTAEPAVQLRPAHLARDGDAVDDDESEASTG